MRDKRAGALIIRDKKLLLVTNDKSHFYWSPGGRLEKDEEYEDALHRGLKEELNLSIKSVKPYRVTTHDDTINAYYFLVESEDNPRPTSEEVTGFHWFSKDDFDNENIKVSPYVTELILPSLIDDDLL